MSKADTKITRARIKELIEEHCGGNQQRFADWCGVKKNSVSQWVNGIAAPGNYSAVKIARAFGVDPLWLAGEDVPKYKVSVTQPIYMSEHEEEIFTRYRSLPQDYRKLVDDMINSLHESASKFSTYIIKGRDGV